MADVAGSLPRALARRGHECAVIMPLYRCARQGRRTLTPTHLSFTVPVRDRPVAGALWRSTLPDCDVPVYLVEQPDYYERDDHARGRGLYQYTLPDGTRHDYGDNCARFVFFCRAVLEAVRLLDFRFDVLHNNDWQTGLVPVYLNEVCRQEGPPSARAAWQNVRTLLTIHNVAYQGIFWHLDMAVAGLPWGLFNSRQLEFYGRLNFLKAGIVFSDLLNTVSPTYAREVQTPYYGCGLQGVLSERRERFSGILNGVDYHVWDPAADPDLPVRYDAASVFEGKAACKRFLQKRYALEERPRTPLLGLISRLVEQKGLDLLVEAAPALLAQDLQLVVLGDGDPLYHKMLTELRDRFPQRCGVSFEQDEVLAHEVEAGADVFLMPSLFEPCGLNQLYSLKYGTVPVVRATGGLADTVVDANPETLADGTATGFVFGPPVAAFFRAAVERAVATYRERPDTWLAVVRNGMAQDWSWDRSAAAYERLYQRLHPG